MAAPTHTPGPWAVGYGSKVVAVYMKPISEGWYVRDQVARFDRDAEGEANARLIAAAPDLLAALKALRNECSGTPRPDQTVPMLAAADAAIAKAELT